MGRCGGNSDQEIKRAAAKVRQQRYMLRHPGRSAANKKRRRKENPQLRIKDEERRKAKFLATSPRDRKNAYTIKRYGLSLDEIDARVKAQGGCACCGVTDPGKRGWQVDHCHRAGHVRGILCFKCNVGLGMAGDDIAVLRQWILYLEVSG